MVEKIGTIRNPLTIIAIFAAIAEISGTMVLPFVAEANQGTYIWFLMIFPILLVVLFFAGRDGVAVGAYEVSLRCCHGRKNRNHSQSAYYHRDICSNSGLR